MALKPVARVGDTGSHGGSIITGDLSTPVNSKPIARVGDIYACPEHGQNPILTGAPSVFNDKVLIAHVGSQTACGATIITGSPDTFVGLPPQGYGSNVAAPNSILNNYDEQVQLIDEKTGEPLAFYSFYIESGDGQIVSGKTDKDGLTPRIHTEPIETLSIWVGDDADEKMRA